MRSRIFLQFALLLAVMPWVPDCCREAQAQIKLSEVKTQTWVGFENPQVVNGVVVAGTNSKPTLATVAAKIVLERSQPYKWTEVNVFREMPFGEADILEEVATTGLVSEYKVKTGTTPGNYLVWFRCSGGDFQPANKSLPLVVVADKPVDPKPPEPPTPDDLPVLTKEARRAMQNLASSMAADMDKAADAVDGGRVKTVLELASFTVPLDVETRNTFKKSMAGPLEKSLGKDALPAGSSKALREVAAGFRSLK